MKRNMVLVMAMLGSAAACAEPMEEIRTNKSITQEIVCESEIRWDGGETNWVDGDLVITYTNVTAGGKLVLPKAATARILAVGGGGGGGRVTFTALAGGGGGGGGGGVVEANGLILKGEYAVTIGKGGEPGAYGTKVANHGENGGNTLFRQGDTDIVAPAIGGGGGGAVSDGLPGGSGGGASRECDESTGKKVAVDHAGGAGTDSQGNNGGDGKYYLCGAGGGGAGEVGASLKSASSGANGGDGIACDISGVETYYGGGGGGGHLNAKLTNKSYGGSGGGGKGIGGSRAAHFDETELAQVNGTDGLGGGGGGGGSYEPIVAGHGGCGTLIVRVTAYGDGVTNTVDAATEMNAVESTAADAAE